MADASRYPGSAVAQRFLRGVDRLLGGGDETVVAVQIGRATPATQSTAVEDAAGLRPVAGDRTWFGQDAVDAARWQRYSDLRAALTDTPEWRRALQVKRQYAFGAQFGADGAPLSFVVTYGRGADKRIPEICEATIDRLMLQTVSPDIYGAGQFLGDSFDELVFDTSSRALVEMRHREPETVRAERDLRTRRLLSWTVYLGAGEWSQTTPIGELATCQPFFMLHYAPGRLRGNIYGQSMFASGTKNRRSGDAVQDFLTMAAMESIATQYLLWPFPREQSADKMWSFVNRVRQAVELNMTFDRSGKLRRKLAQLVETSPKVMPYLVDPELDKAPTPFNAPVAPLDQLLRVAQWYEERDYVVSGVPAALCGMERNVNAKATLVEQAASFAVSILSDQAEFAQHVPGQILLRACIAQGVVPRKGDIRIEMFPPSQLYELQRAQVTKAQAEAAKLMTEAGVPLGYALERAFGLPKADVVAVLGAVSSEAPPASDEAVQEAVERAIEAAAAISQRRDAAASIDVGSLTAPPAPPAGA